MSKTKPPVPTSNPYNREKMGIYGNLGKGANADILFLETVINSEELDHITLIKNIPGSECWDVRDLFQRDVDDMRVENDIIPYFKDENKVKYFSPITLILLPMDDSKKNIIKDIEPLEPCELSEQEKNEQVEIAYEKVGFYKLSKYTSGDNEAFGKLVWNDRKCFLVAIDGQHRLSALKRWKREPNSSFEDWRIPVVILNIFKVDKKKNTSNLLEMVRKTFVYINTKAERINPAREILLNDESVNSICTQEIIEISHRNDLKDVGKRDQSVVPLIFYDWQGKVVDGTQIEGPASIKSVEEINAWFYEYLLGRDGDTIQESELCLTDLTPPLDSFGVKMSLSHLDALRIREQFKKTLQPAFSYLLQNFKPYKKYIAACRVIEKDALKKSDNAGHAFMKLRFGSHNAPEDQISAVQVEFENLTSSFETLKLEHIPFTIRADIGMRGIIYAMAECKYQLSEIKGEVLEWIEFTEKYTDTINTIFDEKWFLAYEDLSKEIRSFLTYLIFDEAGNIINYKYTQAKDALGSLIVIMVFAKFKNKKVFKISADDFENVWADYSSNLRKTYEKGLRRKYKANLADSWSKSIAEFNEFVKKKAEKDSAKKIDELHDFLI